MRDLDISNWCQIPIRIKEYNYSNNLKDIENFYMERQINHFSDIKIRYEPMSLLIDSSGHILLIYFRDSKIAIEFKLRFT